MTPSICWGNHPYEEGAAKPVSLILSVNVSHRSLGFWGCFRYLGSITHPFDRGGSSLEALLIQGVKRSDVAITTALSNNPETYVHVRKFRFYGARDVAKAQ